MQVLLLTFPYKKVTEDLAQVGVVRLVVKAEGPAVLEVGAEFQWEAFAEELDGRGHLLLTDLLVLLLLGSSFQSLHQMSIMIWIWQVLLGVISQRHRLFCRCKKCHVWESRAYLPWKRPPQEVEQHIAQRLDVVPP